MFKHTEQIVYIPNKSFDTQLKLIEISGRIQQQLDKLCASKFNKIHRQRLLISQKLKKNTCNFT